MDFLEANKDAIEQAFFAQAMLNWRSMRANHRWRDYWNKFAA
jgi:hypothetical protein